MGAYLFHLVSKGYSAEQAFEIVRLMNEYVFESPIAERTLEAEILNDSTFDKLQNSQKQKAEKNVSHVTVGDEIINRFNLITVNGDFYTYKCGVYAPYDDSKITAFAIEQRLVIFEFRHIFKKDNAEYNPSMIDDLSTDDCMSALLNRALSGYKSHR